MLADLCRPLGLWERCERISSLDINRSMDHLVCSCPACRPGSFVRTARMAALESPANFGSREAASPEVTSTTNVRLRRHSPRMGGSRRVISSPSTRRGITCEILRGSPCVRGAEPVERVTVLLKERKTHLKSLESKSPHPNSRPR